MFLNKSALILFYLYHLAYGLRCDVENRVNLTGETVTSDGSVLKDGIVFTPVFQYEGINETYGCLCKNGVCFSKCCPMGMISRSDKYVDCVEGHEKDIILNNSAPLFFVKSFERNLEVKGASFLFGVPNCKDRYVEDEQPWYLQHDGQLFIELPSSQPPWYRLKPDQYCIDTFLHRDPKTNEVFTKLDALVCFPDEDVENNYAFSYICMLISCVFFVITIAVYLWVPELRNLHGRVLVAYLMCLLVGFMFLATVQILVNIDHTSVILCLTFSFIIYFSLLSAFFWLNVMCFDIWWTFSGKRGLSLEKLTTRARFNAYAAYAFGIPTGLTILLIALEFSGLPPQTFLPMLRIQGCFLYGTSKLIYLYGPIILLCVSNMVFFTLTAVKIHQIKKETAMLKSKDSSTHDQHRSDEQRLLLYVKLFSVMGINWILEVLSAIYPDANVFWRFTDAYNVLVGLIIFIIFVCKKKTIRLLKKRFKETFRSQSDNEDRPGHRDVKNWREYQQQRGSLDTVPPGKRTAVIQNSDQLHVHQNSLHEPG